VTRLAGAAGLFAASVAGWVALVASRPGTYWQQSDAVVYREAGAAVRHGAALYAQAFGVAHLPFTYPPFAALVFAAASPLSFPVWQVILAACGLCCLVLSAHAALRLATPGRAEPVGGAAGPGSGAAEPVVGAVGSGCAGGEPVGGVAGSGCAGGEPVGGAARPGSGLGARSWRFGLALCVAAVGLWLEPVDLTLHFGQINLILMALVLVDLAAPDTARYKGVAIGLAAGLKLTPLIFLPYLLLTGRVRVALVGAASFAGTVAAGFAVLGRDSAGYWGGQFAQPGDDPVRLVNQSLNGLVLRLAGDGTGAHRVWIAAALAVGLTGLGAAVAAGRRRLDLLGVCLCAATGLLLSPVSWTHHWVYAVAGLALIVSELADRAQYAIGGDRRQSAGFAGGRPGRLLGLLTAGAVLVGLFGWWPLRVAAHGGVDPAIAIHPSGLLRLAPHDGGAELRWTWWQLVYGDAYVLAALAFVLASAAWLAATAGRWRRERRSVDARRPRDATVEPARTAGSPGTART
jgi:alpha-1,2-mannosyltransferase